MSNVVTFPGFEAFGDTTWSFFIDERDKTGGRIQTHLEDERVICGCAEFWTGTRCASASVMREGDQWLWEASGRRGDDFGYVNTLPEAVAASEASMKRAVR